MYEIKCESYWKGLCDYEVVVYSLPISTYLGSYLIHNRRLGKGKAEVHAGEALALQCQCTTAPQRMNFPLHPQQRLPRINTYVVHLLRGGRGTPHYSQELDLLQIVVLGLSNLRYMLVYINRYIYILGTSGFLSISSTPLKFAGPRMTVQACNQILAANFVVVPHILIINTTPHHNVPRRWKRRPWWLGSQESNAMARRPNS